MLKSLPLIFLLVAGFVSSACVAPVEPIKPTATPDRFSDQGTSTPVPATPTIAMVTPSPTVTPTATPQPTATPTPPPIVQATPTVSLDDSLFDALIAPLVNEANRRRAERAKTERDYHRRVDAELNRGRVNVLLFGYGEAHWPPHTEKALIGSYTILSYDTIARQADLISMTSDIRAPEIEREIGRPGKKILAVRIDQAYSVGGFNLMRRVIENATGLSIDFQVVFKDRLLVGLIDHVFGGVDVDVPMEFHAHPYYLDGKKYERGYFAKGMQRMDGRRALQFIKTLPITEGYYGVPLENNARKHLVFQAIARALERKHKERTFWLSNATFLTRELVTGTIVYDFDPVPLVINNLGETATSVEKLAKTRAIRVPKIRESRHIVDPAHGDGGVQWVNANAAVNPITKKDIAAGVYLSLDFAIPIDADPYGDLITAYWPSTRTLVRQTLLPKNEKSDFNAK